MSDGPFAIGMAAFQFLGTPVDPRAGKPGSRGMGFPAHVRVSID
jgi:hypothetical protein